MKEWIFIGNSMNASAIKSIKDLHCEWSLKILSKFLKTLGECNLKDFTNFTSSATIIYLLYDWENNELQPKQCKLKINDIYKFASS